jgi:hypothetical protein
MACIRLAMTTEELCKESPLPLGQVVTATATMAVIRHPALGAVLAVMGIPEAAATLPHQSARAAVVITEPQAPPIAAAAATGLFTPPAVAEADYTEFSEGFLWHASLLLDSSESLAY